VLPVVSRFVCEVGLTGRGSIRSGIIKGNSYAVEGDPESGFRPAEANLEEEMEAVVVESAGAASYEKLEGGGRGACSLRLRRREFPTSIMRDRS
jgi:hypothetical protein